MIYFSIFPTIRLFKINERIGVDPMQKWLPLNYSFVHIQNSLTNLVRDNNFFTNEVSGAILKTRYCPLSIARCDLLAAIFVMLKIPRLLFAASVELFNY